MSGLGLSVCDTLLEVSVPPCLHSEHIVAHLGWIQVVVVGLLSVFHANCNEQSRNYEWK